MLHDDNPSGEHELAVTKSKLAKAKSKLHYYESRYGHFGDFDTYCQPIPANGYETE